MLSFKAQSQFQITSKSPRRTTMICRAADKDKESSENRYKTEFKNLVKNIQTRRMDQIKEIKKSQDKIVKDFQEFHIASLKLFKEDIGEKISKLEDKLNSNDGGDGDDNTGGEGGATVVSAEIIDD